MSELEINEFWDQMVEEHRAEEIEDSPYTGKVVKGEQMWTMFKGRIQSMAARVKD